MIDGLKEQSSTSDLKGKEAIDGLKEQSSPTSDLREAIDVDGFPAIGREVIDSFLEVGRELDSFLAVEIRKRDGLRELIGELDSFLAVGKELDSFLSV
jgi:hypothetical protein